MMGLAFALSLLVVGSVWAGGAKTVQVKGYVKKDGTVVAAHTRSAPGSGSGSGTVVIVAPPPIVVRTEARTEARTAPPTVVVVAKTADPVQPEPVITLTPPDGEVIYLGTAMYHAATAAKTAEVRDKWEAAGDLKAVTRPVDVGLVERGRDFCKVRLGGKVWCVESKYIPAR